MSAEETLEKQSPVPAGPAGIFLLEAGRVTGNGESPVVALNTLAGCTLSVALGILESVEQQSIEVSIWTSTDGEAWDAKPLLLMPQKFYPGTSEVILDLESRPDVRYVRAKWAVNRWGRGSLTPDFQAYLFLRPA